MGQYSTHGGERLRAVALASHAAVQPNYSSAEQRATKATDHVQDHVIDVGHPLHQLLSDLVGDGDPQQGNEAPP